MLAKSLLLFLLPAATASAAGPLIFTFDNLSAFSHAGEQYASSGVHFSPTENGIQVGLANGDSGGWGVNGTSGPYFMGFNGSPSYSMVITFDTLFSTISLDTSRTNGSAPLDTVTLSAYLGVNLVDTRTVTLGAINVWQTVTVNGAAIDRIQISGSGAGFHPFGIDNLQLIPEPPVVSLLLLGVASAGLRMRRRSRVH